MVETFFLDWGLSFGTGLLFGMCGRRELAYKPSLLRTAAARRGALFLHAAVLPIAISLYALEPDWMWMFWVRDTDVPLALVVLCFALYEVSFLAGLAAARELAIRNPRAGWGAVVALGALITAAEVATRDRLARLDATWLLGPAGAVAVAAFAALAVGLARRDRDTPLPAVTVPR